MASLFLVIHFMHYCFPCHILGCRNKWGPSDWWMNLWPMIPVVFCCWRWAWLLPSVSLQWNLTNNSCNQPCLLGFICHCDSRREEGGMCCPAVPTDLCSCLWHGFICRARRWCSEQKAELFDTETHGRGNKVHTLQKKIVNKSHGKIRGTPDYTYIWSDGVLACTTLLNPNVHTLDLWTEHLQTSVIRTVVRQKTWRAHRHHVKSARVLGQDGA